MYFDNNWKSNWCSVIWCYFTMCVKLTNHRTDTASLSLSLSTARSFSLRFSLLVYFLHHENRCCFRCCAVPRFECIECPPRIRIPGARRRLLICVAFQTTLRSMQPWMCASVMANHALRKQLFGRWNAPTAPRRALLLSANPVKFYV
jgi:hypothetical protein